MNVMNQVSGDEELLDTATDYFNFVTKFFEPISVSATHIYHSALELSPRSSIVRRWYYHQQYTPLPRGVIFGTQDSWDQKISISCKDSYGPPTWSPCGRFVAAQNQGTVEIRDLLSFELLSTLKSTEPAHECMLVHPLAYSTDGHSIVSPSRSWLRIWDIQTGGVVKKIGHKTVYHIISVVWSLDGSMIGIVSLDGWEGTTYTIHTFEVASGTTHSLGTFWSRDKPHLWANGTSFQIMTTVQANQACIINIFEVGSILTKIKSFHIMLQGDSPVMSYSQTTSRISTSVHGHTIILDIQNSDCLLKQKGISSPQCFSSDGSLFADYLANHIRIWKYTSGCYTLWWEFASRGFATNYDSGSSLQFSPTSSSLLGDFRGVLHLWHLDGPPIVNYPDNRAQLVALSPCGSYIAVGHKRSRFITTTNLLSQTPSHSIDTGMVIETLALTGNILLVQDSESIMAWWLTKEGVVYGNLAFGRAGQADSIWTIPTLIFYPLTCSFEHQTVTIKMGGDAVHVYHAETGEILAPIQEISHLHWHGPEAMLYGRHYPHYHGLDGQGPLSNEDNSVSWTTLQEGWVKDHKGKHQLWIPIEWRNSHCNVGWFSNSKALRFDLEGGRTIIIKL